MPSSPLAPTLSRFRRSQSNDGGSPPLSDAVRPPDGNDEAHCWLAVCVKWVRVAAPPRPTRPAGVEVVVGGGAGDAPASIFVELRAQSGSTQSSVVCFPRRPPDGGDDVRAFNTSAVHYVPLPGGQSQRFSSEYRRQSRELFVVVAAVSAAAPGWIAGTYADGHGGRRGHEIFLLAPSATAGGHVAARKPATVLAVAPLDVGCMADDFRQLHDAPRDDKGGKGDDASGDEEHAGSRRVVHTVALQGPTGPLSVGLEWWVTPSPPPHLRLHREAAVATAVADDEDAAALAASAGEGSLTLGTFCTVSASSTATLHDDAAVGPPPDSHSAGVVAGGADVTLPAHRAGTTNVQPSWPSTAVRVDAADCLLTAQRQPLVEPWLEARLGDARVCVPLRAAPAAKSPLFPLWLVFPSAATVGPVTPSAAPESERIEFHVFDQRSPPPAAPTLISVASMQVTRHDACGPVASPSVQLRLATPHAALARHFRVGNDESRLGTLQLAVAHASTAPTAAKEELVYVATAAADQQNDDAHYGGPATTSTTTRCSSLNASSVHEAVLDPGCATMPTSSAESTSTGPPSDAEGGRSNTTGKPAAMPPPTTRPLQHQQQQSVPALRLLPRGGSALLTRSGVPVHGGCGSVLLQPAGIPQVASLKLRTAARAAARAEGLPPSTRRGRSHERQRCAGGAHDPDAARLEPNEPVSLATPTWWRHVPMSVVATVDTATVPPDDAESRVAMRTYEDLHADAVEREAAAFRLLDFDLDVRLPDAPSTLARAPYVNSRVWCPTGPTLDSTRRNFAEIRRIVESHEPASARASSADRARQHHCDGPQRRGVVSQERRAQNYSTSTRSASVESAGRPALLRDRSFEQSLRASDNDARAGALRVVPRVAGHAVPWYGASTSARNALAEMLRAAAVTEDLLAAAA